MRVAEQTRAEKEGRSGRKAEATARGEHASGDEAAREDADDRDEDEEDEEDEDEEGAMPRHHLSLILANLLTMSAWLNVSSIHSCLQISLVDTAGILLIMKESVTSFISCLLYDGSPSSLFVQVTGTARTAAQRRAGQRMRRTTTRRRTRVTRKSLLRSKLDTALTGSGCVLGQMPNTLSKLLIIILWHGVRS